MERQKYPRTFHVPSSPGGTSDDKKWSKDHLVGKHVVVTEKMDGENTTIYPDGFCHARSTSSANHPSRDYVRALAARVGPLLRPGMRLCGENLYAKHSIGYTKLPDYFMVFGVWEGDTLLSWPDVQEWSVKLGLPVVPTLYVGEWGSKTVTGDIPPVRPDQEGWVVRATCAISREDFPTLVGKWVRPDHVQTSGHWMHQKIVRNELKRV